MFVGIIKDIILLVCYIIFLLQYSLSVCNILTINHGGQEIWIILFFSARIQLFWVVYSNLALFIWAGYKHSWDNFNSKQNSILYLTLSNLHLYLYRFRCQCKTVHIFYKPYYEFLPRSYCSLKMYPFRIFIYPIFSLHIPISK